MNPVSARPVKVLIADDHPMVRAGLRAMLGLEAMLLVVGEARDGAEAVEKAERWHPDVVLMDLRMPRLNGIEATRRIKLQRPETAVIVLTMDDGDAAMLEALEAGAGGYLLKDVSIELLLHAIQAVLRGGTLVKTELFREMINGALQSGLRGGVAASVEQKLDEASPMFALTAREMQILGLVAGGSTNREIGARLFIAQDTAKKHVQSIIAKLRATDRTHAAFIAARTGLLDGDAQWGKGKAGEDPTRALT